MRHVYFNAGSESMCPSLAMDGGLVHIENWVGSEVRHQAKDGCAGCNDFVQIRCLFEKLHMMVNIHWVGSTRSALAAVVAELHLLSEDRS